MTALLTKADLDGRPVAAGEVVMLRLADSGRCRSLEVQGQTRPVRVVDVGDGEMMAQILTHRGEPLGTHLPMDAAGFVGGYGRWYVP
uniref:hypothetical protein n=1 Tax=Nonomuraea sp. CA-251285 TaxID=3240002 RepID=UPI003F496BEC